MNSILRPLLIRFAKLMIARGVLFPDFVESMKRAYVTAAEAVLTKGKPTDSRLSVMTGLQRRDIARLREQNADDVRKPNHLAALVAKWQTIPDYNLHGAPKRLIQTGPAPSFEALARSIRQDVHPRSMLDALVAAGTVQVSEGWVSMLKTSHQPAAGSEAQLEYLALNVGDHLAAATHNLVEDEPQFYERAVHYNGLSEDAVAKLKSHFDVRQQDILIEMNALAAELQSEQNGLYRFRAGGYFFAEPNEKDAK